MYQNPTHIIQGVQETSGKRFFIRLLYPLTGNPVTYCKVPNAKSATAMSKNTAREHCHHLTHNYPGNTYTPVLATYTIKPIKKNEKQR